MTQRRSSAGCRWPLPAVLLGGGPIALSVARSLDRLGVPVYAAVHRVDPVQHSRACARFVELGSGSGVQGRWLQWLRSFDQPAVVLPCCDDALELVARHRDELRYLGHTAIEADDEVLLAMLDKRRTYDLARQLGMRTPLTTVVDSETCAEQIIEQVGLPCALKPAQSHVFTRVFPFLTKALVARSRDELEGLLARLERLGIEMLASEIVPGGDDRLAAFTTYLDDAGAPLFIFTRAKIRQYPPHFGIGCYQITRWDPSLAKAGLRFLQGVGVRGLASVEFKRDARDDELVLIECNHRFTTATELSRLAGIDQAQIVYRRLAQLPAQPPTSFREGVRLWNPVEDTLASLASARAGELTPTAWVRSLLHRQHLPLLSLHDPAPSIASLRVMAGKARLRFHAKTSRTPPATHQPLRTAATSGPPVSRRG